MKLKQLRAQREILSELIKELKSLKTNYNNNVSKGAIDHSIRIVHDKFIEVHNKLVDATTDQNRDEHF